MYKIFARWLNGQSEEVDTADSKEEANILVAEYRMAYGPAALSVWYEE